MIPGLIWPPVETHLRLDAPISSWDEGIPLGNGLTGGLLWGGGSTLNVSLDRGDLWDERPAPGMKWDQFTYANLERMVKAGDRDGILDVFERAYGAAHPSKLPGGRLVIDWGEGRSLAGFALDLALAEGGVRLQDGASLRAIWSGGLQAGVLLFSGAEPKAFKLMSSAQVADAEGRGAGPDSRGVRALGYPEARFSDQDGIQIMEQPAALGLTYAVAAGRKAGRLAVAIGSTVDGPDPKAIAAARVRAALAAPEAGIVGPHRRWWRKYWSASKVSGLDPAVMRQYHFVRYLAGSGSRRGAPPMPLQGVWTADTGFLPPWKGDYHNDLNTQMTYMGYQAAGDFDAGLSYLEFLWERRGRFQRFAREFYAAPGLAVPGVMTLAGEPLGGWVQYSLSPTMTAWSAHLFYLHWRYTNDAGYLQTRALPWCREAAECLKALLREAPDGRLFLPLSSSPEIFDDSMRAWLKPNSTYDLMSMQMLFLAMAEMEEAAGDARSARGWRELTRKLGPYAMRPDGTLKISEDEDLPGSHRHLSNLMALHPFNLITTEGSWLDRKMIESSLAEWDRFGTGAWTGYSFTWMAALKARVGRAEEAHRLLSIFCEAFVLRNGFHANGDQSGKGYSGFTYRPFTLEGNFLAMNAVHEMLLQSWSPEPGRPDTEVLRIFPACPEAWPDAEFEDLRAEGGHRVSARRRGGKLEWLRIVPGRDGVLPVRAEAGLVWSGADARRSGELWLVPIRREKAIEARL